MTIKQSAKIDASIDGRQFHPKYINVEYKVREGGDLPHKLIIFTEQEDAIAEFCKDGDPVEIQWLTRNESATSADHKVRCYFEISRLTNESAISLKVGDRELLESVWHIIRWECEIKNSLELPNAEKKGAKKK